MDVKNKMKKERHPSIEEIIKVLKHLNQIWKPDTTLKYCLEKYVQLKSEQLKEHGRKNNKDL